MFHALQWLFHSSPIFRQLNAKVMLRFHIIPFSCIHVSHLLITGHENPASLLLCLIVRHETVIEVPTLAHDTILWSFGDIFCVPALNS